MDATTDEKVRVEQELLRTESLPTYHPQKPEPISSEERPTKMPSRVLIFALLVYSLLAIGLVSATVKDNNILPAAASAISELQRQFHGVLDAVKPAPLQEQSADKDQPYIDQNDTDTSRNDHKHEENAAHDPVELAKRQTGSGNGTTTTVTKGTSVTDTLSNTSSTPSTTSSSTTESTTPVTTTSSTLSGTTTASQSSTTPSTSSTSYSSSTTTASSSSKLSSTTQGTYLKTPRKVSSAACIDMFLAISLVYLIYSYNFPWCSATLGGSSSANNRIFQSKYMRSGLELIGSCYSLNSGSLFTTSLLLIPPLQSLLSFYCGSKRPF
jgi:hypothetical protein